MKYLAPKSTYLLIIIILIYGISSCRIHSAKIIGFEAFIVTPGRVEQPKFTSYTLKFINQEKILTANSIKILFNNELEITPIQYKQSIDSVYKIGDTIHCAFSIQNQYVANQSYILVYNNSKKRKQKKLTQPQLRNNSIIPNQ